MRIFWQDKDGNIPPPDAVFSWRPFFPNAAVAPIGPAARVDALPKPTAPIRVLSRRFLPEKKEWKQKISQALHAIQRTDLEKVVLGRCCVLECETAPDPFRVAAALKKKAANATLFCFANDDFAFLGATPERLFIRRGQSIVSEAIAGTRKRGETPEEDEALEKELLLNEKELREFAPVQEYLHEALAPLSSTPIAFSPVQVRKTPNVQHLYSRLTGKLEGASDSEILDRIHPTPALCGTPKPLAFDWIRKLEPFDRGLYGGAIGWSSPKAAEWAVAIRCCLIRDKEVHLYTGTGIVEGSDPEAEWDELNLKMRLYEEIFQ